jgi:hypothetical protein
MHPPYHHASRNLLPISVVREDTPPPKWCGDVAQLIAIDATLSVAGFDLLHAVSEEDETTFIRLVHSEAKS